MGTVEDLKKTSKFPQSQRGYGEWLDIVEFPGGKVRL